MRVFAFNRFISSVRSLPTRGLLAALLLFGLRAGAEQPFTVRVSHDYGIGDYVPWSDFPYIDIINESGSNITRFEFTIGKIANNFDQVWYFTHPPGGTTTIVSPDGTNSGTRSDTLTATFTSFGQGETVRIYTEIDPDSTEGFVDYRTAFFNNGTELNSRVKVFDSSGATTELELPDPGAADLMTYEFRTESRPRQLIVRSVAEGSGSLLEVPVRKVNVKVNGQYILNLTNSQPLEIGLGFRTTLYDDDVVEIIAPQVVYQDRAGTDITASVSANPEDILNGAEQRFTAIGLSVNDVAQSGDPTRYQFSVTKDVTVVVKWQHDYALSVVHDFDNTASPEAGYAGPLNSQAEGNASPPAKKNWIRKGDTVTPQVDGQLIDFSHPGLDIRYVTKGYRMGGVGGVTNQVAVINGTWTNYVFSWTGPVTNSATFRASLSPPPQRQQVVQFTMTEPRQLSFIWQIQFGVKVNADSLTRVDAPLVFSSGNFTNAGEGTFWFNPGDPVRVASKVDSGGLALNGWFNGDGFYFLGSGTINSTTGDLMGGSTNMVTTNATWITTFNHPDGAGVTAYRGLNIAQLKRPVRVLWTYGNQGVAVDTIIGEYVFKTNALYSDTTYSELFAIPPDAITVINISGRNPNVNSAAMTIWDPQAKKLYPLVPGQFRATWRRGASLEITNDVLVTAHFSSVAHYPHVAGTPAVALDPDPNDQFIFQGLRYSENEAQVDANTRFFASQSGRSVLLFHSIQPGGRGEPQEFVEVRVVDTKQYEQVLSTGTGIVGQKLSATDLDRAKLGTGYVMSFQAATGQPDKARFNPFIYDGAKLEGLTANNIYDMAKLRSTSKILEIVNPQNLPGPIIPVNLNPGASKTERITVVWYDNPAENDGLLWPLSARSYSNRWPSSVSEGLGQIVIASQFGSESQILGAGNVLMDQEVMPPMAVPGVGTFPGETTYNPSRFQDVQVYNQPNRNSPGYNPNEEHALIAPSLRFADVSPRPPAVYALRLGDLNTYARNAPGEVGQPSDYTSHPYVLAQFFDTADQEFKMRVYLAVKETNNVPNYRFASPALITTNGNGVVNATPAQLNLEPHVTMEAGEPVIPFYPLGVVIGASPSPDTFGINLRLQSTYWEDHKGTSWAVSGGENAWFTASFFYPLAPDFYWPPGKPGFVREINGVKRALVPQAGDSVSFLPTNSAALLNLNENSEVSDSIYGGNFPTKVLYKSDWPRIAPVLKAGETLTFSGGEFRADHPTMPIVDDDGETKTIQTPGLPGILAFASAEVVFDSLNPLANSGLWKTSWTARVTQALDQRNVILPIDSFPEELLPATGRTRVKQGKYVFNDLPASLQKRVRYDPLATAVDPVTGLTVNGRLEMFGLLNDKDIGEPTLTAAPPAVYVLEPNILSNDDKAELLKLDDDEGSAWDAAVEALYRFTRNPLQLVQPAGQSQYLAGLEPQVVINRISGEPEIDVINGIPQVRRNASNAAPYRAFGPGLALVPNAGFLDPVGTIPNPTNAAAPGTPYPEISWVTVAENNDPALGGSPITLHIIQVARKERYRGAIKTVLSDNVFDENITMRHTGDFGVNADELVFEWWYRPDDGSLNVPPPDLLLPGQSNPWKLFPDLTGKRGAGRFEVLLKGNPNAPAIATETTRWTARTGTCRSSMALRG